MNPLSWARDSIRRRGLVLTSKVAGSVARDLLFDLRHGTNTGGLVEVSALDTESENKSRAVRYQASRAWPLLKLLRGLSLPRDGTFVDFGAGKGRALLVAAHYGFKRVVGVEFSAQLCALARRNITSFPQSLLHWPIEIVEQDAASFPIDSGMTVFYLYNPFDSTVLARVVENIKRSVAAAPRQVWLIYNTPLHHDAIHQSGLFRDCSFHEMGGTDFKVYTNQVLTDQVPTR